MGLRMHGQYPERYLGGVFEPLRVSPKVPLRDKPLESVFNPAGREWSVSGPSLGRMAIMVDNNLGNVPTTSVAGDVIEGLEFVADMMYLPDNDTEEEAEKRCAISYILAKEFNLIDSPMNYWNCQMLIHEAAQRTLDTPTLLQDVDPERKYTVIDTAKAHLALIFNEFRVEDQEKKAEK